jgi:hypothetical protein
MNYLSILLVTYDQSELRLDRINLVGALTIIAGILGVLSPLSLAGWLPFVTPPSMELFILVAMFPTIGVSLSLVGIGFGVATLIVTNWA